MPWAGCGDPWEMSQEGDGSGEGTLISGMWAGWAGMGAVRRGLGCQLEGDALLSGKLILSAGSLMSHNGGLEEYL